MIVVCRHYRRNLRAAAGVFLALYFVVLSAQAVPTMRNFAEFNNITMPLMGLPLTVIFMSAVGTLVGNSYADPIEKRPNLYLLSISNTFASGWAVVLLIEWRQWDVSPVALPPFAAVVAAISTVIIPALFKGLPGVAWHMLASAKAAIGRFFNRPPP